MCNCLEKINKQLKDHNTEIVTTMTDPLGDAIWLPHLKVKPLKGKKAVTVFPSYCPFCGEKYKKELGDER